MENIELLVIWCLLVICAYYITQNKENKYWRAYFKDQYFKEKYFVDKYIEKASDSNKADFSEALTEYPKGSVKIEGKPKKCTAEKGDYPCTIFGCPWCEDCALYK